MNSLFLNILLITFGPNPYMKGPLSPSPTKQFVLEMMLELIPIHSKWNYIY